MWKKVMLALFVGLIFIGLAVSVVGFALGGHYGSFTVENNGQIIYAAGGEHYEVGKVPYWRYWDGDSQYHSYSSSQTQGNTSVDAASLNKVSFNISAGYVRVVPGNEAKLVVDGPMQYQSTVANGEWIIYDSYHNISASNQRFYSNGQDITTTFTLIVPADIYELDIKLGVGTLSAEGFTSHDVDFEAEAGSIEIKNITAVELDLSAQAGSLDATGIVSTNCDLDVEAGYISFEGEVSGKLDADCAVGAITIRVPRPSQYGWETSTELGSITIDGQQRRNSSSGHDNDSISPFFDLDCELGSIEVIFT